ncbi:MAG: FeoA family protein [Halieaceae bacterium]|nr:FeoA family protein [Halieaceae bacterium]
MDQKALSLWQLQRGDTALISRYSDAIAENYRRRLQELGFRPGAKVICTAAPSLGAPKLFRVDNAVYSLDKLVAREIYAESQA